MLINRSFIKSGALYACLIVSSLLILVVVKQLWNADFNVPIYQYSGDPLYYSTILVKGMINNGWYLNNPYVGMPFGLSIYDYPDLYTFDLLVIKLITLFVKDWAVAINIFLVLTFPLTAVSSMIVMRTLKIPAILAFFASLLFTFIPYHLIRGNGHLFLSDYSAIPLAVLLCVWICTDEQFLSFSRKNKMFFDLSDKRIFYAVLICILVSLSAVYYVFFTCFFLCVAGVIGSINFNKPSRMLVALILVGMVAIGLFVNLLPSVIHEQNFSSNNEVSRRSSAQAEIYGLKIIQLLLPAPGHRIPFLANLNANYSINAPLVNENVTSSLGVIGGLGFVLLVARIFYRKKDDNINMLDSLSLLNLSGILLATIGGLGAVIAFVISPQIRAYNRISVFIAFICLLAVSIFMEQLFSRYLKPPFRKIVIPIIIISLFSVGILDQTNDSFIQDYKGIKAEYYNDKYFVEKIENTVQANSMIFQLPYIPFLVNPTVNKMVDYDLFRGYAHSKTLRWSYGIVGGSYGDKWQQQVSSKPVNELLETISFAGFSGIYIDRFGYADNGAEVEKQISSILKVSPIISGNQRLVFYNMDLYNNMRKAGYAATEWEKKKNGILFPIDISWRNGFSILEGTAENNWRWCSNEGMLVIENYTGFDKTITINMNIATWYADKSTMHIKGRDFSDIFEVDSEPSAYSRTIVVPPGEYLISFISDAKQAVVPGEQRDLYFYVKNFNVTEK